MVTIVTRAGKGSELTHNEVDANFTNLNDVVSIAARKYTTTIGNGTDTTFTITHNLGTKDVAVKYRVNGPILGENFSPVFSSGKDSATFGEGFYTESATDPVDYIISFVEDTISQTDDTITIDLAFIYTVATDTNDPIPTNSITVTVIG